MSTSFTMLHAGLTKQIKYAGLLPALSENPAIIIGARPWMIKYVVTVMLT
jgi:hypothetical protein